MPFGPGSLRSQVGSLVLKFDPDFEQRKWRKRRHQLAERTLARSPYREFLGLPLAVITPEASLGRPTHVVVVPHEGSGSESFQAATRNFYFEAARNLAENIGEEHVSFFSVQSDERPEEWHIRLAEYVFSVGATHVLTHIESDPSAEDDSWSWDVWWELMASRWDGVFLGVMFDSAFEWIRAKSRRMGRISSRFIAVDICMPIDGALVRKRNEVGPVNMPVSRESLALVQKRLETVSVTHDVSFIGALYPYRIELLDQLRSHGVRVAVNPHRGDATTSFAESRTNQPTWLDYMAGLASSHMTINFSRSSAGPYEQLTTRVLEATLAGTVLLTDDWDRTRCFYEPDLEFVHFPTPADLPRIVYELLNNPNRLAAIKEAGRMRANTLAHTSFWGGIEDGLIQRGLPRVANF